MSLDESHYKAADSQWVDVYSDALSTPFDPCSIMMYAPDAGVGGRSGDVHGPRP